MKIERSCSEETCDFTVRTKPRDAETQATHDELTAHIAEVHGGVGSYSVRERRAWLIPLAAANGFSVVVSAILLLLSTVGIGGGNLFIIGIFFPQVWGTALIPPLGIGILIGATLLASIVALVRPPGRRLQAFFAAITMTGFIVWVSIPVITIVYVAWLSANWPS